MTLTQLEYFCMVCRYHSITRAADALYVSQPTISTSIRDLEKEFHLKLFNHGKNRISLTKDGAAFYQKAEFILKQTQELYQCHLDKDCFIVRNSYTADKHFVYLLYFYLITLLT